LDAVPFGTVSDVSRVGGQNSRILLPTSSPHGRLDLLAL
jgi:hypothetical protein